MVLQLPLEYRARVESILNISLRSETNPAAPLVPLRELVTVSEQMVEQPIYRKNLKSVIYVTGDVADVVESPVYAILEMNKRLAELDGGDFGGRQENSSNLQSKPTVLRK